MRLKLPKHDSGCDDYDLNIHFHMYIQLLVNIKILILILILMSILYTIKEYYFLYIKMTL